MIEMALRTTLRRLWILAALALAVLAVQPIHSRLILILLLVAAGACWLGLAWLPRSRWVRLTSLLPLSLIGLVLLPGRAHDTRALRASYVAQLAAHEGSRYIWGGENLLGIDCSGLVRRGLIRASLARGVWTLNGRLVRLGLDLWWHDLSARALGQGGGGRTHQILTAARLDRLDHSPLRPGDLAVTADGVHVMAYLGRKTWIEADPDLARVVRLVPSSRSFWLQVPVRIVRWNALAPPRAQRP